MAVVLKPFYRPCAEVGLCSPSHLISAVRRALFLVLLIQGLGFTAYFGWWSIRDYLALEQAVAMKRPHEELRHRINVGFEGVWFLLSELVIIQSVIGLHGLDKKPATQKIG